MEIIPEEIKMKIILDATLLVRQKNGWDKIHYNIKHSSLYLKKTQNRYVSCDIVYENILRANTIVYFTYEKTFTWLKKIKDKSIYYYCPSYLYSREHRQQIR
jgi:hypothetical protein